MELPHLQKLIPPSGQPPSCLAPLEVHLWTCHATSDAFWNLREGWRLGFSSACSKQVCGFRPTGATAETVTLTGIEPVTVNLGLSGDLVAVRWKVPLFPPRGQLFASPPTTQH